MTYDYGTSTDPHPHEGDGNVGTGRYGANPFATEKTADPYRDARGEQPAFGESAKLKSGKSKVRR